MSLSNPEQVVNKNQYSLARLLFFSHMALATTILMSFAGVMFWMSYRATYEKVESELLGAAEILDEQLKGGISPQSIAIPEAFFHRFGKADRDHAYWRLWDHDGNEIKSQGKCRANYCLTRAISRKAVSDLTSQEKMVVTSNCKWQPRLRVRFS